MWAGVTGETGQPLRFPCPARPTIYTMQAGIYLAFPSTSELMRFILLSYYILSLMVMRVIDKCKDFKIREWISMSVPNTMQEKDGT